MENEKEYFTKITVVTQLRSDSFIVKDDWRDLNEYYSLAGAGYVRLMDIENNSHYINPALCSLVNVDLFVKCEEVSTDDYFFLKSAAGDEVIFVKLPEKTEEEEEVIDE